MKNSMISCRAVLLAITVAGAVGCGSQAEVAAGRGPAVASLSRGCGAAVVKVEPRPAPPAIGMCR